jgi:hypothetical protein
MKAATALTPGAAQGRQSGQRAAVRYAVGGGHWGSPVRTDDQWERRRSESVGPVRMGPVFRMRRILSVPSPNRGIE